MSPTPGRELNSIRGRAFAASKEELGALPYMTIRLVTRKYMTVEISWEGGGGWGLKCELNMRKGVYLPRVNELYVDDPDKDSGGKIDVSLNISLPNLHCELVGLDIQDEMGRHEVGHIDNSMKIPLNNGEGCRFEGQFSINKVPGNFHVSTHSATAQPQNPDMTHVIHKLSFGDTLQVQNIHGAFNALGGADKLTSNPLASHDYILKIVPTVYEDKSGKQRYSYQYTVANKVSSSLGTNRLSTQKPLSESHLKFLLNNSKELMLKKCSPPPERKLMNSLCELKEHVLTCFFFKYG
ncbi:endoplasmic reticulum-Golgi intermediate compartment protein 1-like [Gracilinanus agilis]|uniref:endoplasmic reticulum-Golgi intermediate compartment protein 1-like n=1 Tax=Gracilinanus agilis TaxID=191870 RepID=UPI001CFD703F|nr:endoplasmic reticulum-Golgi intermediate compartment protein 1-like [Gracilinanus agilis]